MEQYSLLCGMSGQSPNVSALSVVVVAVVVVAVVMEQPSQNILSREPVTIADCTAFMHQNVQY